MNSCTCPRSGHKDEANCTKLACPAEVQPPSRKPPKEEGRCCPQMSFTASDGCNTCMCSDDGWKNASSCTRMACPPWMALTQNCTPFTAYPAGDGLNTCICPQDGRKDPKHCTHLECPRLPALEPGEGECCPGVSFPAADGCNTCICPASGQMSDAAACTLMACPEQARRDRERCQPFVAFPKGDGTNTCTCPSSGLRREAHCTSLPCPVPAEDATRVLLP